MSHTSSGAAALEVDPEVADRLGDYDTTRAPLALKEAADAAAAHDGQAPPDPALAADLAWQRLGGWLAILSRIFRDLPPDFDPASAPPRRVEPPIDADGVQLPPGVSPDSLNDPDARRAYIEAITQNEIRRASYARDFGLYQAAQAVVDRAPASIADTHASLGLPKEEIAAALAAAPIRPEDRAAIEAALTAAP
jgi:hypothetical protein